MLRRINICREFFFVCFVFRIFFCQVISVMCWVLDLRTYTCYWHTFVTAPQLDIRDRWGSSTVDSSAFVSKKKNSFDARDGLASFDYLRVFARLFVSLFHLLSFTCIFIVTLKKEEMTPHERKDGLEG